MVDKTSQKQNQNTVLPELITLKEASETLKVHPNTLRLWDKKGILVAVRIGEKKIRRYRKEDILKFIENGQHGK